MSSFVIASPDVLASASRDLGGIGSAIRAANVAAAPSTTSVVAAAADEVSASVAHLFSRQAQDYQALAGQAAAFHEQFVQNLTASAGSYAGAEAANTALLPPLTADSIGSTVVAIRDQVTKLFNAVRNAILTLAIIGISVIGIIVQFVRSLLERAVSFIRELF